MMSKPLKISVMSELISAMSSLNMYPDGNYDEVDYPKGAEYLSEKDSNARHSMEHLSATWDMLQELRKEIITLKQAIMRTDISKEEKYAMNDRINELMSKF